MRHSLFLGFLLLTAVNTCAQDRAPKHLLRRVYEPDRVQFFRDTSVTDTKMQGPQGVNMDSTFTMTITRAERVLWVKDGRARIEKKIHRMELLSTGTVEVEFDSDDPESDPGPYTQVANLVGTTSVMTMDLRARVVRVGESESKPSGDGGEQTADTNEPDLALADGFPDQPVAVGESWQTHSEAEGPDGTKSKATTDSKLVEVKGGVATIEQVTTLELNLQLRAAVKSEMSPSRSTLVLDLASGRILKRNTLITTSVSMPGNMKSKTRMATETVAIDPPKPSKEKGAKKDQLEDGEAGGAWKSN